MTKGRKKTFIISRKSHKQFITMEVHVIIDELPFNTAVDNPPSEKIPLPSDKKFHIFFSYRDVPRDKLWVKTVIDKLEREYGYTCCDHERDFLPGTKIMDNIKDGVKNSEKVVVVFSKEAINSHYVLLEAEMAHKLSLERRKNLLIPVLLDDCDVPDEFMLLTYIDAREGVEETTWWPKLMKVIESTGETSGSPFHVEDKNVAVGITFAVNQLCFTETKYSCLRCTMEANTKYVPAELRSEAVGVPDDLIRATYKDLLQSPRVACRLKCCCFAIICVVIGSLGLATLLSVILALLVIYIYNTTGEMQAFFCSAFSFFLVVLIASAVCCFAGCKYWYLKNPNSVHNKIIEYNKKLSKYGVMATVVHGCMWKKASIVFYKCRFQPCKEYVIRHLVKEESTGRTEHRNIPDSNQMMASTDDLPPLSGVGEPRRGREVNQNTRNVAAIDPLNPEEDEHVVDVADTEPLLSDEKTENLDYETKALNLLMWCTPEYFALTYANKLKNPKEDRHGIDVMCLCQYLEQTDKDFRGTVKKIQSLRLKINSEENDQDENKAHLKNISLY